MKALKIALLTYSTKARGSVIHTLELAQALHTLGHHVCVYALDKEGKGFDYPLTCKFKLIKAQPVPKDIDSLIHQRIQECINGFSQAELIYDCYHAQDCISANALSTLVQHQKIPHFIRTVHHIEDYNSIYLQQCQDRSIRTADLCLCVSDRWQTELQQHYQIYAPRVFNGVNLERFSSASNASEQGLKIEDLLTSTIQSVGANLELIKSASLRERLGLSGTPLYLTIGGIEPRKNSLRLLQAFAQVLNDYPAAQLVIAGGATLFDYQAYRDEFFNLADTLQVRHALVFPGVIANADLPLLYRLADAFVFPSSKEGWGLVLLEAIASQIPVITSNQAPFTEFLSDHQALLVDPNSPAAIAHAMRVVLQPKVAQSLVDCSQTVLKQYTWRASAEMHLRHYHTLLARKYA